ncbi:MAG: hypothetical protein C0475_06285 [Planctomyces sp.]|nr:hypothetical protein [Planctomyces sp.]MBA4040044.1 hypothetical protein [Planctomyces sp.]
MDAPSAGTPITPNPHPSPGAATPAAGARSGAPVVLRQQAPAEPDDIQPVAAVLAWVLPGLGHWYLGQRRRAVLVGSSVLGLFGAGVLIAGIGAIDAGGLTPNLVRAVTGRGDPVVAPGPEAMWFVGQAFVGPVAFAIDYAHQTRFKVVQLRPANPRAGTGALRLLRPANPWEIRHPATGEPVTVRDPDTGAPVEFTDPRTGAARLGTAADQPPYQRPLGRVAEIGRLYCAVAGGLNLIAIVDATMNRRQRRRKEPAASIRLGGVTGGLA